MSISVHTKQRRYMLLCTLFVLELTLLNGLISNALSAEGARPFLPLLNWVGYEYPPLIHVRPAQSDEVIVTIQITRTVTGEMFVLFMPMTLEEFVNLKTPYATGDIETAKGLLAQYLYAGDEIISIDLPRTGGPRPRK